MGRKKKAVAEPESERVEWIGKPKSASGGRITYTGVRKGDEEFRVGEHVLLQGDEVRAPQFVAQLLDLWYDERKKEAFMTVKWYYRPHDVQAKKAGTLEIFASNYKDTNTLEPLAGLVTVLDADEFFRKHKDHGDPASSHVFYVKSKVDPKKKENAGRFTPFSLSGGASAGADVEDGQGSQYEPESDQSSEVVSADASSASGAPAGGDSSDSAAMARTTRHRQKARSTDRVGRKKKRNARAGKFSLVNEGEEDEEEEVFASAPTVMTVKRGPRRTVRNHEEAEVVGFETRLDTINVPKLMKCREKEIEALSNVIENSIEEGGLGGCVYVSGLPGTGKTASVHWVMRRMQEKVDKGELPNFQYVEINGMRLSDPKHAYSALWKALTGEHVTARHAVDLLTQRFSTPSPRRHCCVVLVDELDLLVTRKQHVLYNFFDWPRRSRHARLLVIGIANTMDLPERMLPRVASRLGLQRVSYHPYTFQQLTTIIKYRLEQEGGAENYTADALEMCARKVASVSGDVRRALEICKRAAEIAQGAAISDATRAALDEVADDESGTVQLEHIMAAIGEMQATPRQLFIQRGSVHERVFLVSLVTELRSTGKLEAVYSAIADRHVKICRLQGIKPPTPAAISAICQRLHAARLILLEDGNADLFQRVRLNVADEDVDTALKEDLETRFGQAPRDPGAALASLQSPKKQRGAGVSAAAVETDSSEEPSPKGKKRAHEDDAADATPPTKRAKRGRKPATAEAPGEEEEEEPMRMSVHNRRHAARKKAARQGF